MARTLHSDEAGEFYHVTTRTSGQAFYLESDEDKRVITDALGFYQDKGVFNLYGYVIMSNHLHMVVQPLAPRTLSEVVRDLKKWTSRQNRSKPDGADLWERRYDDNQIGADEELVSVLEYMHDNPVRVGLVARAEEYLWSSARNYARIEPVMVRVKMDW
jgi:REP element-mobilizing transposase RayT